MNNIVGELIEKFKYIEYLSHEKNSGGQRRQIKEQATVNYVSSVLNLVLSQDKYENKYKVCRKYKFSIENGLDELELDIAIMDKTTNKVLLFLEVKDYADKCMYKRFVLDCFDFEKENKGYPYRTGLCIDMQHATSPEIKKKINYRYGINSNNFHSILPSKRNSKNPHYVLDYSKHNLIEATKKLYLFLDNRINIVNCKSEDIRE